MSKAKFDVLDTTIGINIEKELSSIISDENRLRLYMRVGWKNQGLRSHSTVSAKVQQKDIEPLLDLGLRNTMVLSAGFQRKLNRHWNIVGEWNGGYNKKRSDNEATLSMWYTF